MGDGRGDYQQLKNGDDDASGSSSASTNAFYTLITEFVVTEYMLDQLLKPVANGNKVPGYQVIEDEVLSEPSYHNYFPYSFSHKRALTRRALKKLRQADIENDARIAMHYSAVIQSAKNNFKHATALKTLNEYTQQKGAWDDIFGAMASMKDFVITCFRSFWQVVSNAIANNGNNDANNANSSFNKIIYKDGNPDNGFTAVGWLSLVTSVFSLFVGLAVLIYQTLHKKWLASFEYYAQQIKKLTGSQQETDEQIKEGINAHLKKSIDKNRLSVHELVVSNTPEEKKIKQSRIASAINKIYESNPVTKIRGVWRRLGLFSFAFWVVWFPFALKFGLAAAGGVVLVGGIPLVPIIVGITLLVGVGLILLEKYNRQAKKTAEKKAGIKTPEQELADKELARLEHEAKLFYAIKRDNKAILHKLKLVELKQELKLEKRKLRHQDEAPEYSGLKRQLLGSSAEQYLHVGVTGALSLLGGILTLVFVAWFASSGLLSVGLVGASDFIGGSAFGGIAGVLVGIVTSITSMTQLRQQQLAREQKVNDILQARYRNTDETKEQAFQRLYAQVEYRKSQLRELTLTEDQADYLDKIDVYNDRYFEKFEHNAGAFTWFKKGLKRAFAFVYSGQSGAFAARFFLLKGGVLAGALGGVISISIFTGGAALIPFLIAAGTLLLIYGVLAVIDYQIKANQGHREKFLETIDARIYYLEKKNKELGALQIQNDPDNADKYLDAAEILTPTNGNGLHHSNSLNVIDSVVAPESAEAPMPDSIASNEDTSSSATDAVVINSLVISSPNTIVASKVQMPKQQPGCAVKNSAVFFEHKMQPGLVEPAVISYSSIAAPGNSLNVIDSGAVAPEGDKAPMPDSKAFNEVTSSSATDAVVINSLAISSPNTIVASKVQMPKQQPGCAVKNSAVFFEHKMQPGLVEPAVISSSSTAAPAA